MEQKFPNNQRVTIIKSKKNTEADIPFIGRTGTVFAYDAATTIYIIKFDDETTRPFYESELVALQELPTQQPIGNPALREIKDGICIEHERLDGTTNQVVAIMHDGCLNLMVGNGEVLLTEGETAYFLAHMAFLYEKGE